MVGDDCVIARVSVSCPYSMALVSLWHDDYNVCSLNGILDRQMNMYSHCFSVTLQWDMWQSIQYFHPYSVSFRLPRPPMPLFTSLAKLPSDRIWFAVTGMLLCERQVTSPQHDIGLHLGPRISSVWIHFPHLCTQSRPPWTAAWSHDAAHISAHCGGQLLFPSHLAALTLESKRQ